jgi:hypothetical protein
MTKGIIDKIITDAGGVPPVDRTKRETIGGMDPNTDAHRELKPNGQQKDYVVLSEEERKRGLVRPVRRTYVHVACGVATTMGLALAETYARDPSFYSGTYCCGCRKHFNLVADDDVSKFNFKWDDGSGVGS